MTAQNTDATRAPMPEAQNLADWRGKDLIAKDGAKLGKLEEVYVDVDTDLPIFGSLKQGWITKHLTFVPLLGATVTPDSLTIAVSAQRVKGAPSIAQGDELGSTEERDLYHHYGLAYSPTRTPSGRRLARR